MREPTQTLSPVQLDEASAVKALGALAQAQRLRAFRALVVAGPAGLTPGNMAEQLGVAPSALSFHLLGYHTEHCCEGHACEEGDAATQAACVSC
jgi:ArsR family transcriptional regulator